MLQQQAHGLAGERAAAETFSVEGVHAHVLRYLALLSRKMSLGLASPTGMWVRGFGESWFRTRCAQAGLHKVVSPEAFCEGRLRLGLAGAAAGALLGAVFSTPLMIAGGLGGLLVGFRLPRGAVVAQCKARVHELETELPELLEVTALGLRSGLSFDRSFALYAQHFPTAFGKACAAAQTQWNLGLKTREQALRELADGYEYSQFRRVIETIIRALRFGSSLSVELEQAAAETRAVRRTHRQEQAAKAPVKMMIPTGTLILPAMLLLVLGPVLLEMMGGF
ncbi:MAG: type II secretion system F family protein [Coriobacteriia bacterium]|nr:type II secretion system F family protein [Coriobacteriia bacterium]